MGNTDDEALRAQKISRLQIQIVVSWLPAALVFIFMYLPFAMQPGCPENQRCSGFEGQGLAVANVFVLPVVLLLAAIATLITVYKAKTIRWIRSGEADATGARIQVDSTPVRPATPIRPSRFDQVRDSTKTFWILGLSALIVGVETFLTVRAQANISIPAVVDSAILSLASGWALWVVAAAVGIFRLFNKKTAWTLTLGIAAVAIYLAAGEFGLWFV